MPYTFTSLGADDITFTTHTGFSDNSVTLVTGWWRPTTSVSNSGRLWSFGNVVGLSLNTTDRLELVTQNATTNGVYNAAACGMVLDEWRFVAYFGATENTGVLQANRLWTGSIDTAPEERTWTVTTAPVGTFTGSGTFYIGNRGTSATLSFGGQIADVSTRGSSAGFGATTHAFGLATSGVITDIEARHVYETYVLPLWLGDTSVLFRYNNVGEPAAYHCGLDVGASATGFSRASAAIVGYPTVTINGATWSQEGAPRPRMTPAMWPDLVM
jgi:hypothetical protein